jgi:hypothetical protein
MPEMIMFRYLLMLVAATTLLFTSLGCDKKPQQPRQAPPAETGEKADQPDSDQPDSDTAEPAEPDAGQLDASQTDAGAAEQAAECPKARDYQGMCAQVITWAQDPDTGQCCQYGSPCEAPENWPTFTSEADCAQAGGQTAN